MTGFRIGIRALRICIGWATGRDRQLIRSTTIEPVDSSAAAIAAQGLLRLGKYLKNERYWKAGLTVCELVVRRAIS